MNNEEPTQAEIDKEVQLATQIQAALDSLWVSGDMVLGKLHARDELLDLIAGVRADQAEKDAKLSISMFLNEADGYYGQACYEVAAAIRMSIPVAPTPTTEETEQ